MKAVSGKELARVVERHGGSSCESTVATTSTEGPEAPFDCRFLSMGIGR